MAPERTRERETSPQRAALSRDGSARLVAEYRASVGIDVAGRRA
jgi:hypothetical protein